MFHVVIAAVKMASCNNPNIPVTYKHTFFSSVVIHNHHVSSKFLVGSPRDWLQHPLNVK